MKLLIALSALVVLAAGQSSTPLDELVDDPQGLKSCFNCFVDEGTCDDVLVTLKEDMSEAIQQACSKCGAKQKVILKKFLTALKENVPADYEVFKQKFDPEDKYFEPLYKAIADCELRKYNKYQEVYMC